MKEETRDIKELLQILLDHIIKNDGLVGSGLCWEVVSYSLLNRKEMNKLLDFIYNNRPKWYQRFYSYKQRNNSYYWPQGDIKIRIKWLKYKINKL